MQVRQCLTVRRHPLFALRLKVPLKELFVRLHEVEGQALRFGAPGEAGAILRVKVPPR
jgi:hypothetical protein